MRSPAECDARQSVVDSGPDRCGLFVAFLRHCVNPGRLQRAHLTCDLMVTYCSDVDAVFKALADPTRRRLLDMLFRRDGQTLGELEGRLAMTRFGVMKHLRVLESAKLV